MKLNVNHDDGMPILAYSLNSMGSFKPLGDERLEHGQLDDYEVLFLAS